MEFWNQARCAAGHRTEEATERKDLGSPSFGGGGVLREGASSASRTSPAGKLPVRGSCAWSPERFPFQPLLLWFLEAALCLRPR